MALGTNHVTGSTAASFIPELWSDEVIAGYKKNLVLANLVTRMSHVGKKGDTIHIPSCKRKSCKHRSSIELSCYRRYCCSTQQAL